MFILKNIINNYFFRTRYKPKISETLFKKTSLVSKLCVWIQVSINNFSFCNVEKKEEEIQRIQILKDAGKHADSLHDRIKQVMGLIN